MGKVETNTQGQEPLPTQQEVVRKLAGLYADILLYRQLLSYPGLTDNVPERMKQAKRDIYSLVTQTLPRIQSQEITGIRLIESPSPEHFFVVLPGDKIRISMNKARIEREFPQIGEMIAPWKPPQP